MWGLWWFSSQIALSTPSEDSAQVPGRLSGCRPCSAFLLDHRIERLTSAKFARPQQRQAPILAEVPPLLLYYNTSRASVAEVLDKMANNKSHMRRCSFCYQVGASEATHTDICFRHQLLISLRLIVMFVRSRRFIRLWRLLRWWIMNRPYFSPFILQQQAVTSHQLPPVYLTDLTRTIGVLQQLQMLCASTQVDVSLDDVIQVIRQMQCEFGERSQLEQVIQSLVGRHLSQQLAARQPDPSMPP